jgi:hypothetical protein
MQGEPLRGDLARERPWKSGFARRFAAVACRVLLTRSPVHVRAREIRESSHGEREASMKYGLLWLLGVPIPVLIIVYLMFHH